MRRYGRVVAFLFAFGSVSAIPGAIIVDADPLVYPVIAVGVAIGVGCLLVPWERLDRRVLFIPLVLGIVEVVLGMRLADLDVAFYFIYVAVLAGYVTTPRAELAIAIGLILAALFSPFLWRADADEVLHHAVFAIPAIVIAVGMVRYLAETLEVKERTYERFAAETLTLAERIRGGHERPRPPVGP
jgi:MFS family permease